MKEITFKDLKECMAYIVECAMNDRIVPQWAKDQEMAFENAKKDKSKIAKDSKTPIYDTLVKNYPYGTMPEEKKKCIVSTVNQLLEEGLHAEEPGLLLGKIQCGKTDTFEDIIGLAFDRGIDITVVLTKGTKPLAQQTLMRMKKDYRFFKETDDIDQRTTINIYDIMDVWKNMRQARVEGCKTVIVCKKQATNLDHLIDLFEKNSSFLKRKKVLIVDDEADFASRNYRSVKLEALRDEDGNPIPQDREMAMARLSQQIDDFRKVPAFCRYLQVTATPYCLYLQPQGELNLNGNIVMPFKPRFTSLVPVHSTYIGGKQYFEESQDPESMYSHLFHQIDQKCLDVLGHEDKRYLNSPISSSNIYGLTYAIVSYFMATAVRRIQVREEKHKDYKTSALIHVELDRKNHDWQNRVVRKLIEAIKNVIVNEDQTDQRIWTAVRTIYDDFVEANKKGREAGLITVSLPSQEDILDEIRTIFNPAKPNYLVQIVNSDEQVVSLLDEETGELRLDTAANIFIGGNILDRGITIKNMLCFFYGRNPKNFQQDTVLQHARMYGARSKEDLAVTRLHTTDMIHRILVRMNELDNQLREWFINGNDKAEPNAVFVGYDNNIKPCATQKIKASNTLTLKKQMRMLPIGFWTGYKKSIGKIVTDIDTLIEQSPNFDKKDQDGFFEIDRDKVYEILRKIEQTYVYDEVHQNENRKNDIKEILCAMQYCTDQSNGKIYALYRTNREMSRLRDNGGYIDAPDDGRTDTKPSRNKAQDAPVIMFLRQNGSAKKDDEGVNVGWNNTPFYWPVFLSQNNISPVMFALDQSKKGKAAAIDLSEILKGINSGDVLKLTYAGDLEKHFGKEGSEYEDDSVVESRGLKDSTASKYIEKDETGKWKFDSSITFDKEHDHGLYSLNHAVFPFVMRNYKYMLLRNGRDARADIMLLELHDYSRWNVRPEGKLDHDGNLYDRDGSCDKVLITGRDGILDRNMNKTDFMDDTITQWVIYYSIKKVVKSVKHTIDCQPLFDDDQDD